MRHLLYYHIVWTTAGRSRLIDAGLAQFLCRFLRAIAREERAHILELGLVTTHVHVLIRTHPMTDISRLLQRMKGSSAAVAGKERHSDTGLTLRWAKGYTIQTVGHRQVALVREYVRQQPRRHEDEAIPGWAGDQSEYEPGGGEEWIGPDRRRV